MRIYTKTGDQGETSLYAGGRVKKCAPRVEAYGTLDEANAAIGLALAHMPGDPELMVMRHALGKVQRDLFCAGAMLASTAEQLPKWHLVEADVTALEQGIDRMEEVLSALTTFILPGGHPAGAGLHVARTVVRRAERLVVNLPDHGEKVDAIVLIYLNRLSDYLFVAARHANHWLGRAKPTLAI